MNENIRTIIDIFVLTMALITALFAYLKKGEGEYVHQRERIIMMLYAIFLLLLIKV